MRESVFPIFICVYNSIVFHERNHVSYFILCNGLHKRAMFPIYISICNCIVGYIKETMFTIFIFVYINM